MRSFRIAQIVSLFAVFFAASTAYAVTTESVLHPFPTNVNDGNSPRAPLIQGSDGFLYGTTEHGGNGGGHGMVFKIAADGSGYQDIHDFGGSPGDGAGPVADLVQASDGNLYGTTIAGGANNEGVIFEINTSGSVYQVVHSFSGGTVDGSQPQGNIIQATDGFLYGTTEEGGANSEGTIYKFAPGGSGYQLVFSYNGATLGAINPISGLYQGPDGFFYGTSFGGGSGGDGTVYKILPNGTGYLTLHSFAGGATDGAFPLAGVVEAPDGFLYGATEFGGTGGVNGEGALFMVHPDGTNYSAFRILTGTDGASPLGGLTVANDGNLYGATQGNGTNTNGSIFSIAQGGGSFTRVYDFGTNPNDGSDPVASPVLASDGSFYGTTLSGGLNGQGTVYKLGAGLLPAPTGLTAIAGDGKIMLSWNAYPNASSYNVYAGSTSGGETLLGSNFTSPSTFVAGLTNGVTSFFKVTAVVSAVETAQSSEVSATPEAASSLHVYPAGLQMISVPADYTGFAPWQAFDNSAGVTLAAWSSGAYAITPTSPANVMVPGPGYWVRFGSSTDLLDIGVDNSGAAATQIPLVAGWNLIGNPDPSSFAISTLQIKTGNTTQSIVNANKAGIVGADFYTWQATDTTSYEVIPISSGTFTDFEGYWVFAFQPCTLIVPAAA